MIRIADQMRELRKACVNLRKTVRIARLEGTIRDDPPKPAIVVPESIASFLNRSMKRKYAGSRRRAIKGNCHLVRSSDSVAWTAGTRQLKPTDGGAGSKGQVGIHGYATKTIIQGIIVIPQIRSVIVSLGLRT